MTIMVFVLSLLILGFSFVYCAVHVMDRKKPLLYKLYFFSIGCYLLGVVYNTVVYICGGFEREAGVQLFCTFGTICFILSANYDQIDGLVDPGEEGKKARILALIAPALVLASMVALWFVMPKGGFDRFDIVCILLVFIPILPASYFNLKHLILPLDDFNILINTKWCNVAALCYYVALITYYFACASGSDLLITVMSLLCMIPFLGLSLASVKGVKEWLI